jgi:hypothetical protein
MRKSLARAPIAPRILVETRRLGEFPRSTGGCHERAIDRGQTADAARTAQCQAIARSVRGLDQPGGKLPLFDAEGQRIDARTIKSCIENRWAEPWFQNPLKPDWLVCKLTELGRALLAEK